MPRSKRQVLGYKRRRWGLRYSVQCQQNLHRQQDRNKGSCSSIKCPPHASAPRTEGTIELLFKPKYLVTEAFFFSFVCNVCRWLCSTFIFLLFHLCCFGTGMLVQVSQFHGLDNAWFSQTGVRHTQRFCDICHIFDGTGNRCEVHKGFWHIRIKGLGHKGSAAIWLGNNCLAPDEERKGEGKGADSVYSLNHRAHQFYPDCSIGGAGWD